jgi:peptidoglycan/xylan/chitin deacetylase (PgdA/CDA1 family)
MDGLRELLAGGHVIGSHGWSHRRLDRLTDAELDQEFIATRSELEQGLGVSVTMFAPAGGIGFKGLGPRLEAAGYVGSRSTRWGIYRDVSDRWVIPTLPVTQLTVQRGWVDAAATRLKLPIAMSGLGVVREVVSQDLRSRIRSKVMRRREEQPPHADAPTEPGA